MTLFHSYQSCVLKYLPIPHALHIDVTVLLTKSSCGMNLADNILGSLDGDVLDDSFDDDDDDLVALEVLLNKSF